MRTFEELFQASKKISLEHLKMLNRPITMEELMKLERDITSEDLELLGRNLTYQDLVALEQHKKFMNKIRNKKTEEMKKNQQIRMDIMEGKDVELIRDENFEEIKQYNIRQLLEGFIQNEGITKEQAAQNIGISRSALSQYLSGKYQSDPTAIENKVLEYLKRVNYVGEKTISEKGLPFLKSQDAINILGICKACRDEAKLGFIVGDSGHGKTFTLKQYAKSPNIYHLQCSVSMTKKDLIVGIENAIGIPAAPATIWERSKTIMEYFKRNRGGLLIIDEADKLISKDTVNKLEVLRDIYDQTSIGLVLAGEPALQPIIKAKLPRLANRVDLFLTLNGLSKDEVKEYIKAFKFTPEARELVCKRATDPYIGCFRLLNRTMKNIMKIIPTPESTITVDIVEEASNMMMM